MPNINSVTDNIGLMWSPVSGNPPTGGPVPVNASGTGLTATSGPSLQSISDLINSINRNAQKQANLDRIPGGAGLEQQSSNNISSELAGRLPGDVITQLTQNAAERGVGLGIPQSDNNNSALLRSLGLNSLALQQTGQQNLTAAEARNPAAPIFNPATQLLTPFQSGTLANEAQRNQLGSGQLSLDWYRALNNRGGGGGLLYPSGGGGYGMSSPGSSAGSSSFWNSLFPPSSTSTGSSDTGGGNIYDIPTLPTYPGTDTGTSLPPNDPGLPDLGMPPVDFNNFDFNNFDPSSMGLPSDTFNNYDPFQFYG